MDITVNSYDKYVSIDIFGVSDKEWERCPGIIKKMRPWSKDFTVSKERHVRVTFWKERGDENGTR